MIFVGAGIANLAGYAPLVAEFDTIGLGQWFRYVTAFCQITGALLLHSVAYTLIADAIHICIVVGAFLAQSSTPHGDVIHTFV